MKIFKEKIWTHNGQKDASKRLEVGPRTSVLETGSCRGLMGNQGAKIDCGQKQGPRMAKLKRLPLEAERKESDARKSGFRETYLALVLKSSVKNCFSNKNILRNEIC